MWADEAGTGDGPRASRRPGSFAIGDVVDKRYELRRELGRGAAGLVFEAKHRFTGRRVALKIVSPDARYDIVRELHARLLREARALAAVHHPGIVEILDGGLASDGTPYIAMEMLEGRTLEGLLAARGKLAKEDAVGIALQLCDALAAAHRVGVVHRDLKPGNVFLVHDGYGCERVKLVDFGIAQTPLGSNEPKLTGIGALLGTPEYMSPEQLLAFDDLDARTDVYSLGVTLYECLTGRVPYAGTYQQVLLETASPEPAKSVATYCPEAGPALANAVDRAIAKRREDRFVSIVDFAHAIQLAVPHARMRTRLLEPAPSPRVMQQILPPPAGTVARAIAPISIEPELGVQRRRAPRTPYVTPVSLLLPGGQTTEARNEDISEGGMLVILRGACPPRGTRLLVRFALPLEGRVVTCAADVRWAKAARAADPSSPHALGLSFVDPSPEIRASIGRYVEITHDPSR